MLTYLHVWSTKTGSGEHTENGREQNKKKIVINSLEETGNSHHNEISL